MQHVGQSMLVPYSHTERCDTLLKNRITETNSCLFHTARSNASVLIVATLERKLFISSQKRNQKTVSALSETPQLCSFTMNIQCNEVYIIHTLHRELFVMYFLIMPFAILWC